MANLQTCSVTKHSSVSLQHHLVSMKTAIFRHKFSILGRLRKLSSSPPPSLSQHNHNPLTPHQVQGLTTILQQPATPCPHRSSLHLQLEQLVLSSPHTRSSLKSHLALPHPHLFLPHHYLHSRLPISLQHLTLYRLWPHLSHQCRHQLQQVAPAVGVVLMPQLYCVWCLQDVTNCHC